MFELVRVINQEMESGVDAPVLRADRAVLRELLDILGLLQHTKAMEEAVPDEIVRMVQERSEAREAKDWARADELRAAVEEAGYVVEDTDAGPVARKAKR
jgi:cysteinyl-tRNA synthetase